MEVVFVLLPLSLVFVGLAVGLFIWAVKRGQFDDLETPAVRMLFEDEPAPAESDESDENGDDENENENDESGGADDAGGGAPPADVTPQNGAPSPVADTEESERQR